MEVTDNNFDEFSQDKQAHIRKLLREGKVEFSEQALAQIAAKGMTEDDIVAMLVKASSSHN